MPLTLSLKDYSKHSGVGIKALRRLIADKKIPATKISNKFMILVDEADEFFVNECNHTRNIDKWFKERKTIII